MTSGALELMAVSPVLPVVTIADATSAVPLARALLRGGIGVMEITLRTEAALDSVRRIADQVPEVRVGVGSVTQVDHVRRALSAGATFLVSPGLTTPLAAALAETGLPTLPGVATVGEMLRAGEFGFKELKFFPAAAAGGPSFLNSVAGPLPEFRFCPTGGVTQGNVADWLRLPNVECVGGSWLTPATVVAARDWEAVSRLAERAAQVRHSPRVRPETS